MTTIYWIRHATNDFVGKAIAGRKPEVHLNELGRGQAEKLAQWLSDKLIQKIWSSPLARCLETANPLARKLSVEIEISEALNEIDFGDWTGNTLQELDSLPLWKQWNQNRSGTRIPNGESILQVQARVVDQVERIRAELPNGCAAIFSHGDPIRAALVHYLGMPLDFLQRIEISPASISVLNVSDHGAQIVLLNEIAR